MGGDYQELGLSSPWLNAAGCVGFRPARQWPWPEPAGAFVTNPLSLSARTPAANRQTLAYEGGFLLHSGLPNPGLRSVLKEQAERWKRAALPVWVHLLANSADEAGRMVRLLEGQESVAALELGIPPQAESASALALVEAAAGELPLVVNIPLNAVGEAWTRQLAFLGVSAVSLGAPRGLLPARDGRLVSGRLYGPGLLPLALAAVQLDTVLWKVNLQNEKTQQLPG